MIAAPGTAPISVTAAIPEANGMPKETSLQFKDMMAAELGQLPNVRSVRKSGRPLFPCLMLTGAVSIRAYRSVRATPLCVCAILQTAQSCPARARMTSARVTDEIKRLYKPLG
ncbi:MAG: hypothetical protein WAT25_21560 [Paracoccaceae bacterium]